MADFILHVRGNRKNVEAFIDVILYRDSHHHFFRPPHAHLVSMEETTDGKTVAIISGYCDNYNIEGSMNNRPDDEWMRLREDIENVTTLPTESKRLNLEIEVYSSDFFMEFEEHYKYAFGECLAAECVHYEEYYFERIDGETPEDRAARLEEEHEENGLPEYVTLEKFNESEFYTIGGFDWVFEF